MQYKRLWCRMSVAVSGALVMCGCSDREAQTAPGAIRVDVEPVVMTGGGQWRSYVGVVEENECTALSFAVAGMVRTMNVTEGAHVAKGSVLAELDRTTSKSALDAAEAALSQAQDAHRRMSQLYESSSLPEIKMVEMDSRLQQAQSAFDMARKNYDDGVLRAPFSGVIGRKRLSAGENVMPGQAVCTLLDIDAVKIKIAVPEMEIAATESSDSAEIRVPALAGRLFRGRRIEKGVQANPLTHTYDVYVNVDNMPHVLLPGMVCDVGLRSGQAMPGLSVPLRAVQSGGGDDGRFVWTVRDGKAHRVGVVTGEVIGNRIFIGNGLHDGDSVIVDGYQKVGEGTKVIF